MQLQQGCKQLLSLRHCWKHNYFAFLSNKLLYDHAQTPSLCAEQGLAMKDEEVEDD